ncbi:hypothetical protein EMIHUDRAFT_236320 [Emiliania huxleyi CCMP1516]|uniref:Uncharacterized protein n=2 Tax=Emiliania huxleyi TaxID=2903 RepID=A0A0D3JTR4_EMIH1|nr:hypothetical protein EMIHUDRAFT_236320 [Emiliania huxleyi CCMP1516]EOD26899.1 hypothetical protein EMIHUDRAFT_236320 [Emiliania huxleyi CCMP1516]|eukprot:XP_005779328.1 hypothetical protein EMIHUDRAFT_236320 [Emiliania huxleyi CCMP1516]
MLGLKFQTLKAAADYRMRSIAGKTMVLHLIEEDIYLDVEWLEWTADDGRFSYRHAVAGA